MESNQQLRRNLTAQFQAEGYVPSANLGKETMQQEINKLIRRHNNLQFPNLRQHILDQIWAQCPKNHDEQVAVADYINVIVDAKIALESRQFQTEEKIKRKKQTKAINDKQILEARATADERRRIDLMDKIQQVNSQINSLQADYTNYVEDYNNIMVLAGKKTSLIRSSMNRFSAPKSKISNNYPTQSAEVKQPLDQLNQSYIFYKRSDKLLLFLIIITIIYLILQLLIINHKYHFLNLLVGIGILAIFGLDYFDSIYMRLMLLIIACSGLFDIIWLIVKFNQYLNPVAMQTALNTGFYKFIIVVTIVLMLIKLCMGLVIAKYLNNQQKTTLRICGTQINLTGQSEHNPITKYLISLQSNNKT